MAELLKRLEVELAERSYPILIGRGLLGGQDLGAWIRGEQVMIVTNETVGPLYLEKAKACFPGRHLDTVVLPDGEIHKNWQTLNRVFDALLTARHTRKTTLVALGGGVVGDMTGFAAACYQRGVDFIQLPTTLLSQVDSSVGGKTGINHPLGKNMIGAFHQPRVVMIDTDTLKTLPAREFAAGLAEVIKYGLIREPEFLAWLEKEMPALRALDSAALAQAVYRSCACKAAVVAADEFESGIRAILNLGHTFGHAIETFTGYGQWLHGEAVAVGTLMACDLSWRLGMLAESDVQRVAALLRAAGLPQRVPDGMTPTDFRDLMAVDKKNVDGRLRLVLLRALGSAEVTADFAMVTLDTTLKFFCNATQR